MESHIVPFGDTFSIASSYGKIAVLFNEAGFGDESADYIRKAVLKSFGEMENNSMRDPLSLQLTGYMSTIGLYDEVLKAAGNIGTLGFAVMSVQDISANAARNGEYRFALKFEGPP